MGRREYAREVAQKVLSEGYSPAVAIAVSLVAVSGCTLTSSDPPPPPPAFEVSIGAETSLEYPIELQNLPNGYTSFLPTGTDTNGYLLFAASTTENAGFGVTGAVVLETADLVRFSPANGFGSDSMGGLVFTAATKVCPAGTEDSGFEHDYAAPGSVVRDPTLPAGNLIMIYEAGVYCYTRGDSLDPFASVGLARSSDGGKTWPASGAQDRYPILQVPGPKPLVTLGPFGDADPSAFIDDVAPGNYLYVVYRNFGGDTAQGDDYLHVARAQLGQLGQLTFSKWYQGAWIQPGIGGMDSPITPQLGCSAPGTQHDGQISYLESHHLYVLTFVCPTWTNLTKGGDNEAMWYFSTATSLEKQDWSPPTAIEGSMGTVGPLSSSFSGWYPSSLSPGMAPGHLGDTGVVFSGKGGPKGNIGHTLLSRTFAIR
jgi:hypothetical protein